MKKYLTYILIIIALVGIFSPVFKVQAQVTGICADGTNVRDGISQADCATIPGSTWTPDPDGTCTIKGVQQDGNWKQSNCTQSNGTWAGPYVLLASLPCQPGDTGCDANGKLTTFDPTGPNKIGGYLNLMIRIFIGLCAVLAVVMIVIGGIEYMTTELISSKEAGKERIRGAIFGLLLALGAWTLLNQINPDILKTDLNSLQNVTVDVTTQNFALSPSTYIVPLGKTGQASGTNCDENVVATSNQTANAGLSNDQIHTLACIGGIESGCKSVQNYAWGSGSSAYGPFQITLQGNAGCFENNVCRQAAGVSGPLNCAAGFSGGNPIPGSPIVEQCKKAASNFTCSVSAAACLIKKQPNYGDWNANPNLSKCK